MALLKVNKKWTCYHLINAQLSPCTLHLLLGVPRSRRYLQMGHQVAQGTWPPYRTAQIRPRVFRRWRHWNVNFYACADLGRFASGAWRSCQVTWRSSGGFAMRLGKTGNAGNFLWQLNLSCVLEVGTWLRHSLVARPFQCKCGEEGSGTVTQ